MSTEKEKELLKIIKMQKEIIIGGKKAGLGIRAHLPSHHFHTWDDRIKEVNNLIKAYKTKD